MNLYLRNRFYICLGICITIFLLAFAYPIFMKIGWWALTAFALLIIVDFVLLRTNSSQIRAERQVVPRLSLGDKQGISYTVRNESSLPLGYELTDELPHQFQHRAYIKKGNIPKDDAIRITYPIQPTLRGKYDFGALHLYISTLVPGLLQRKVSNPTEESVEVYPSFIQMKKYEMQVFTQTATLSGIRRVREIGENDEFEHIRNYAHGDNIKSINWRATSRRNELMVNQYENSKSQMVYCIIDKGRSMKMPFEDLSLLDYAINTTLVISNIILRKYDKAGLITFSDKIGTRVKADAQHHQLQKITRYLYDQQTGFKESNFELLFYTLRAHISRRSILLLFTNFEQQYDMRRNLKYLKSLNQKHLLILIMFVNTELDSAQYMKTKKIKDIYYKTFAQRAIMDKEKIANELRANGIQVILTKPDELSINTVNKYLEIKAKRMR